MTFLSCGNIAFELFLRNLILNFQMDYMRGNTLIIVCLDCQLHAQLERFVGEVAAQRVTLVESPSWSVAAYANYGTVAFRDLTRMKFQKIAEYARKIGEIYYADGDVVFFRDPVPEIRKCGNYDLLFQPEHPSRLYENPCAGNLALSGSRACLAFMESIIALYDLYPEDDQHLVVRWLKMSGSPDIRSYRAASLQIFHPLLFQSGYVAFRLGQWKLADKVCVHANFRIGLAAKVHALRHCGGWFV